MSQFSARETIKVPTPEELSAQVKPLIKSVRHFKSGKINRYGKVLGVVEYSKGKVPFEHQDHHYDDQGRVIMLEKFTREFSKPTVRYYMYREERMSESVWIDRYGKIENFHHYRYDDLSSLLVWRGEFDHEGKLFYSINSAYDSKNALIQEAWNDANNKFLKRFTYTYDKQGELETEGHYGQNDQLIGVNTFKYDAKGNLLERRWADAQGKVLSRFVYTIDNKNQVSSLQLFGKDGKMKIKQEFAYDETGNVVRERWFDERGSMVKDLRF